MEFLAPLMGLGVAGAAIPIAIHLIGRRRAPIVRFAALDFLLGSDRKVARRLRLRELILLAMRTAACLAIPLALAKPFVSCSSSGPLIARGPQAVALVIDDSFAMGYRLDGETLFSRARDRARAVLEEVGPEAEVAVLFTAEGSGAPSELSRDHLRLADTIERATLTRRPADTSAALGRAAALLAGSPHATRRVYLFSALAATGFPPGEPPWPAGGGPELVVDDLSGGVPLPNVAVTGARAERDPDLGPRGLRVTAELANFGPTTVTELEVTLRLGDKAVARGLATLGPGEGAAKRFSITLPADATSTEAVVEVAGDSLAIDDRRHLRLQLKHEARVLLVNGDPRTVRHDDETFYLETALRPGDRADSALIVTMTTVDDLPRQRLADHDVVFLCNAPALDAVRVRELEAWVRKGGGLFVALGDHVDPDAYNATMRPLLAQELGSLREAAPGTTGKERDARAEHLGRLEVSHPVLQPFSPAAPALREAHIHRYVLTGPASQPGSQGESRRVLMRYENHAPALLEARLGQGRLMLLTTAIDRDWSDLPIHKGFLPLMQSSARYLARAPTREDPTFVLVGRTHEVPVTPGDTRIEIASPSGRKRVIEGEKLQDRSAITFGDVDEPGLYRVAAAGTDGVTRPRPQADFVAHLDPRGSDLRRVAPEVLPDRGTAAALTEGGSNRPRRRVELWHGLAAALLLFLVVEGLLIARARAAPGAA